MKKYQNTIKRLKDCQDLFPTKKSCLSRNQYTIKGFMDYQDSLSENNRAYPEIKINRVQTTISENYKELAI